jgi:hypothetical protein
VAYKLLRNYKIQEWVNTVGKDQQRISGKEECGKK